MGAEVAASRSRTGADDLNPPLHDLKPPLHDLNGYPTTDERRLSKAERNGSVVRARRPRLGRVRRPLGVVVGMRAPQALALDSPKRWATRSADIARPGKEGPPRVDLAPELRRAELVGVFLPPAGALREPPERRRCVEGAPKDRGAILSRCRALCARSPGLVSVLNPYSHGVIEGVIDLDPLTGWGVIEEGDRRPARSRCRSCPLTPPRPRPNP